MISKTTFNLNGSLRRAFPYIVSLLALFSAGCDAAIVEPPRLATQTAQVQRPPTSPATPFISEVATPTAGADAAPGDQGEGAAIEPAETLTVWINETQVSRSDRLMESVDRFSEESGLVVDLVMIAPDLLPDLVQTAVISETLPDVIIHPIEYSAGWTQQGILNPVLATEILETLDRDTFDPAALEMLAVNDSGRIPAIPSHGWQQLILYRTDWFSRENLQPPQDYDSLYAAAETLYQPESVVSGIIIPTDSTLVSTQRAFELIAAANGCELVDDKGEITILRPECLEALEYYRSLINQFSPIGVQTDISALNAYLAGRTGIIFSSPSALPGIANLVEDFRPICPDCDTPDYLADNTGILTTLTGSGELARPANFGAITAIGITSEADPEAAESFIQFWFDENYESWLSDAPEMRVPMRLGTEEAPMKFIEVWRELPMTGGSETLAERYGDSVADMLSAGIASESRWGFMEGQGDVISSIHQELILSELLQEMLSGYFTSSQTIVEMYLAIVDRIPGYEFPIEVVPTEEA